MNETIEWQESGGGDPIAIVGSTDALSDLRINGQLLVQLRTGLRATAARPINRGNLQTRISVAVAYAPAASVVAAKTAVATLTAALLAASLDHVLLEGEFSTLTWQLEDAALESYEFTHRGLTVYGRFAFVGGAYSAA